MQQNRLISEKSPYLLQHAHNPVDWFGWGEEAFERARAENKPIFLSVGYSTCHWCHVMERESFENPEIAALMNRYFVNIKVDREERPDVDKLYMNFVMLANRGQGGWPMSVFLTPELKPFFGGTYYPPIDAWGRPGFPTLLEKLADAWRNDRDGIEKAAHSTLESLANYVEIGSGVQSGFEPQWQAIHDACFAQLSGSYDQEWGGFGGPPKFPRPVQHDFLHAFFYQSGNEVARRMSEYTLRMMADRGMNDQLGGGFHRYSVDGFWIVSHFEKMLYDQAQLVVSYLEMFQITGDRYFAEVAEKTLRYVWRDMTNLDGAFFAAEDADSLPKHGDVRKEEGAFYVWKRSEIESLLGQPDATLFCDFYHVRSEGNAPTEGDPHGEFKGQNILFEAESVNIVAKMNGLSVREVNEKLENARAVLFDARQSRPRPHRDEKIITAWNGLMISAYARAGVALDNPKWTRAARNAANFLLIELWDGENLLRHFKDGPADVPAFCDDYAALARACLDLYDATLEIHWIERAQKLAERMAELFYDQMNGGFFNSQPDPRVLLRFKEDYDGAEPSASALAVEVGARLWQLLGREEWRERSRHTLNAFAERLAAIPSAMPLLLKGQMLLEAPPQHIVIAGEKDAAVELLQATREEFAPFRHIILLDEKSYEFWATNQSFLSEMRPLEGVPTAYVCQNYSCQMPVTTANGLRKLLLESRL